MYIRALPLATRPESVDGAQIYRAIITNRFVGSSSKAIQATPPRVRLSLAVVRQIVGVIFLTGSVARILSLWYELTWIFHEGGPWIKSSLNI